MSGIVQALIGGLGGGVRIVNPLPSATSVGDSASPAPASGSVTFNADGTIIYSYVGDFGGQVGSADVPNWHPTESGIGAGYWVRATATSGTLTTGTTGAWLQLNTARTFTKGPQNFGNALCQLTFDFSNDAGATTIVSSAGWQVGYSHDSGPL